MIMSYGPGLTERIKVTVRLFFGHRMNIDHRLTPDDLEFPYYRPFPASSSPLARFQYTYNLFKDYKSMTAYYVFFCPLHAR